MAQQYLHLISQRRTYYSLSDISPVPDLKIIETVQDVLRHTPSSLNGRTSRVVVLLGDEHRKLWDMALDILSTLLSGEQWAIYEKKLNDRKAAYGTVSIIYGRSCPRPSHASYSFSCMKTALCFIPLKLVSHCSQAISISSRSIIMPWSPLTCGPHWSWKALGPIFSTSTPILMRGLRRSGRCHHSGP